MKTQLLFALLIITTACNQSSSSSINPAYLEQIKNLSTDKDKNDYLYNLWQLDQNIRTSEEESSIINKHGYNSKEHKSFLKTWIKKDQQVFQKLKLYLEIHGYPKNKSEYHELAINAFPIIIGHNHDYKAQKELLPYLYNAYKEGYCSVEDVVWILGEMYESKHGGKRYNMTTNKFTTQQEFTELVEVLNLKLEF